jgi:hypothetical protein
LCLLAAAAAAAANKTGTLEITLKVQGLAIDQSSAASTAPADAADKAGDLLLLHSSPDGERGSLLALLQPVEAAALRRLMVAQRADVRAALWVLEARVR